MMFRKKFSWEEIADIVMLLTGEVEPVGDSSVDDRRYDNLIVLINVVDRLLEEIEFVLPHINRHEYSMQRAGNKVKDYFEDKIQVIQDYLDEWCEKDED